MSPQELQRTAHTVECFLNALGLEDGPERTRLEEWLVNWLTKEEAAGPYAIYNRASIHCYAGDHLTKSFSLPGVTERRTIWCDRKKLSIIDAQALSRSGKLVMLGTAGLALGMPGSPDEPDGKQRLGGGLLSNNNNNNNNNNNAPSDDQKRMLQKAPKRPLPKL
ncbi:MAG TPA: hypothetical protein VLQ93_06700 [Myxococcaceae bacterium]|nr:hypothetical protein [Myxococcaceae bacterium]